MAYGVLKGLHQVSYDNDQYRAVVKDPVTKEPVLVSIHLLTMRGAIRDSSALGHYFSHASYIQA
jgi:hypothetical protein